MRQVLSRRSWGLLLAAILLCLFVGMAAAGRQLLTPEVPQRPNVLFILTDDQAQEDLANMANVQSLLVEQGTSFSNAFATTPACCPSRVSFMRGQYVHNHGVLTNDETPVAGYDGFIELGLQDSTVATWLDDAGYDTFYAGKFLNGYVRSNDVVPGWDRWYTFSTKVNIDDYEVNENGELKTYTQDQLHDTYYLRDRAEAFIRSHDRERPWFAWVSTHAPHGPQTIAPEFKGSYDVAQMPKPPSYNEADVSDKPAWVQRRPLMDDDCSTDNGVYNCHKQVVEDWRERQESLQSVDVMVEDLVKALAETNQLDRTYIVFATDNGYMLGQHRLYSKGGPYEENQGIPFVVRGPGVRQGVVSDELVANMDLAPTIAEWAGVEAPKYVDGRSLVPLLEGKASSWRRYLLFEQFKHLFTGVRTADGETYVEHEAGEKEYYDLTADPWQLDSAHSAPENADRLGALSEVLLDLKNCAGASCRAAERDCSTDQADNDDDGVVDEPGETCSVTRPPDTAIDAGPESLSRNTPATFTFSTSEENSTFECSLDGAGFEACNPENNTLNSKTYDNLDGGEHTFLVRAIDREGIADPSPASYKWTVDATAPNVVTTFPGPGTSNLAPERDVVVTFSEEMDHSTIDGTTYKLYKVNADGTSAEVSATVQYRGGNKRAILDPDNDLEPGATYRATVTTGTKDLANHALDQDPNTSGNQHKTWTFKVSERK